MKILIGCPVRNRAWVLPYYLNSLEKIKKNNKYNIDFYFIINDSVDDTKKLLSFYPHEVWNTPAATETEKRGTYSYDRLANLRNRLCNVAIEKDVDFLLSIDSDIIVSINIIESLMNLYATLKVAYGTDKIVISPLVRNYPVPKTGEDTYPAHNAMMRCGVSVYRSEMDRIFTEPFVCVDVTGACTLIPKSLLSVRYGFHPQGEDCLWSQRVQEAGGHLFVTSEVSTIHYYDESTKLKPGISNKRKKEK